MTTIPDGYLAEENVLVTVANGGTFTTKLSTIECVQITYAESSGTAVPYASVSGRTITFGVEGANAVDADAYVTIKGRL